MAITYFPFDAGAGASVTEDQWRAMARHWLGTGVLADEDDELAVSESGTPAMSVDVATGQAWLRGHFVESDAVETAAINASDPTDDRIDRVVLRADFTANTISIEVLEGTPDPAPTAPALTQSASRWEISLAQVLVEAAASSILDADITDERGFAVAIPPGTEVAYAVITTESGGGAVTSSGNGDDFVPLGSVDTENEKYYCEIFGYVTGSGTPAIGWRLHEGTSGAVGALVDEVYSHGPAATPHTFFLRFPFTPAAGSRSYHLRWRDTGSSGNVTVHANLAPFTVRIVKAA